MIRMDKLGRYLLRREIGRGAMGIVYEAYDEVLERVIALKTINAGMIDADERAATLERFSREAKAAARITHPNIVTIFDFGVVGDTAYIAMEMIEAPSLKQKLREMGRVELRDADRIVTQLLDALGAAHRGRIVHRDIKPSNIMVLQGGQIKVADFGIARIEASSTLTQTGTALGTPSYMAPEQLRGLPVDGRADLFSAGVVLYEMLSGHRPFEGDTTVAMYKVLHETPQPLSALDLGITPNVDAVVARALEKEASARFASAEAFADAWRRALAGAETASRPVPPVVAAADPTVVTAADPTVVVSVSAIPVSTPARRARAAPWVLGLLALVALGAAGYIAYAHRFSAGDVLPQWLARSPQASPAAGPAPVAVANVPLSAPPGQPVAKRVEPPPSVPSAAETPRPPPTIEWPASSPQVAIARPSEALPGPGAKPDTNADDEGVPQISPAEIPMLQAMAAQGRPVAMHRLGVAYSEGWGVAQNHAAAAQWFQNAAQREFAPSMRQLGVLYRDGKGVAQSDTQALTWFTKAAGKGNRQAMTALGFMVLNGRGTARDERVAMDWFTQAARHGDRNAMFELGVLYEQGRGVRADKAVAMQWYQRAALLGETRARERVAR
jgi:TPR repeat protein/tRNA A-37 threonylcarbamoyl transferase component Bud32